VLATLDLAEKCARPDGMDHGPRLTRSGGQPLDLPMERNRPHKSFEDLANKYAPGNHPGRVLKEHRPWTANVCLTMIPELEAMTPADIQALARKYLRPETAWKADVK
jgi:hypothetical protein